MRGFSLVELSIVLVILGLLTGGILAGQSLIRASELRSLTNDISRYQSAVYTFRDKYFGLPGDVTTATKFWGDDNAVCPDPAITNGTPGTCNGNGDGTMTNADGYRAWQHLQLAGLIEGTYTGVDGPGCLAGTNCPKLKIDGSASTQFRSWPAEDGTGASAFATPEMILFRYGRPTNCADGSGNGTPRCPFLKPEETWNLDVKMDDGKPAYGKMNTFKLTSPLTPGCATTDTASTAEYALSNNSIACMFHLRFM